jgi:ATP-binding cassette subfamily F protein uup
MANRIIELSRRYPDGFLSHHGTYSEFLDKREEFLAAQQGRERALASGVRREIEWLKRKAKARTTKAKGRIDRADQMMSELADLRERNTQQGAAKIDFTESGRKTRKLIELKQVAKSLGGRELFRNVSFTLAPGTKLGLLGPNGSGKSTLIRLIAGELEPDAGEIFRADQLRIVVFDQHREQLDQEQTLRRALSPAGDSITVAGSSMHISAWARQFLFRPDQLDLPVRELSGGEQARVLIARLMQHPADVLVLDEPTNDLDLATLEVLEQQLEEFAGALLLVTHDRYLLDFVSTEILALDGNGAANIYADLSQWENARRALEADAEKKPSNARPRVEQSSSTPQKKRLTWSEQRELKAMHDNIHRAEAEVEALQSLVADPALLADHTRSHDAFAKLADAQQGVERLYARWSELDAKQH